MTIEQVERVGGNIAFNRGAELPRNAVEPRPRFFRPGEAYQPEPATKSGKRGSRLVRAVERRGRVRPFG